MPDSGQFKASKEARVIVPADLIGAKEASRRLGIDKSNLLRRIDAGKIVPLAQLDGPGGAYVFDSNDIPKEQKP